MSKININKGADQVDGAVVAEATKGLSNYIAKKHSEDNNLFEADTTLVVNFGLNRIPSQQVMKPHLMELPHPLFDVTKSEVCVIVRDDLTDRTKAVHDIKDKYWKNLVLDNVGKDTKQSKSEDSKTKSSSSTPAQGTELTQCIKKVISVTKLKKQFREFAKKRELCDSYDLFLADKSVIELMPTLLGKYFYKMKSKAPIPVTIKKDDPMSDIARALASTQLKVPSGPCVGVKIGNAGMDADKLVANAEFCIKEVGRVFDACNGCEDKAWKAGEGVPQKPFKTAMKDCEISKVSVTATNFPAVPIWQAAFNATDAPNRKRVRKDKREAKAADKQAKEEEALADSKKDKKAGAAAAGGEESDSESEEEGDAQPKAKKAKTMPLLKEKKVKTGSVVSAPAPAMKKAKKAKA